LKRKIESVISRHLLEHMNTLWPVLIVSELLKHGIDTYFLSPGNRNVPIMAALGAFPGVCVRPGLDERASAYRAIGHAKATGRPGVLVCTSGTAAANYYPAVIEAFRDEIPMIVWSADRPHDLVGSDANQTIDQQGIFSRFVYRQLNLPSPSADYPLAGLLSKVCDLAEVKNGPVHINLPFREPLLPVAGFPAAPALAGEALAILANPDPHTINIETAKHIPTRSPQIKKLQDILGRCKRGLVVAGRPGPGEDMADAAIFAEKRQWPIFCDMGSGIKGLTGNQIPFLDHPGVLNLIDAYDPEAIIQFGTGLVSKAYYGNVLKGRGKLVRITPRSGLRNPGHHAGYNITMSAHEAVLSLNGLNMPKADRQAGLSFRRGLENLIEAIERSTPEDILSHPVIAKTIYSMIPGNEALFAGNSLVIRAFDGVLPATGRKIDVVSNRGVSGIEGNIATALGYAEGAGKRITLVLGDISFLHDLNSLVMVERSEIPVVVIVINNRGGRIFDRLPVAGFEGIPGEWVTMPHQYDFKMAAAQFSLPYWNVRTPDDLKDAYEIVIKSCCSALIEICLNPGEDLRVHKVRDAIKLPADL
jgi:2-succinyl-5-enolpyruvyl-6-hydroxy-3-cyclohexene-1-carboxylate synthase